VPRRKAVAGNQRALVAGKRRLIIAQDRIAADARLHPSSDGGRVNVIKMAQSYRRAEPLVSQLVHGKPQLGEPGQDGRGMDKIWRLQGPPTGHSASQSLEQK
jgi:hypothetical protein